MFVPKIILDKNIDQTKNWDQFGPTFFFTPNCFGPQFVFGLQTILDPKSFCTKMLFDRKFSLRYLLFATFFKSVTHNFVCIPNSFAPKFFGKQKVLDPRLL